MNCNKLSVLTLCLLLLAHLAVVAQPFNQDTGNPNLDFSAGNFNNWNIAWGPRTDPDNTPGAQAGANSHTIVAIYGNNFDGNAGNGNLQRVPRGLERVGRLGAPAGGGYTNPTAYYMRYDIQVHAAYPVLHFQIASIMDRTHSSTDNTHYRFKLINANGNSVVPEPCGGIELFPGDANGGNATSIPSIGALTLPLAGAVMYQPWQSVAIDLSAFAGQTVSLQFEHFDCISGFHGSYDYIAAAMRQKRDTFYYCPGSPATIKPYLPNFKSYTWSNNGSNADTLQVSNPIDGGLYTCTVTSYNGCSTTFNYILKAIQTVADFTATVGTQCNEMVLQSQATTGSGTITAYEWTFGDPGSGSNQASGSSTSHVFSAPGNYTVTLKVTTSEGCEQTFSKTVTVAQDAALAAMEIIAPYCVADTIHINDITTNGVRRFWQLNAQPLADTGSNITLTFTQPGPQHLQLLAIGANGCPDTTAQDFMVHPNPTAAIVALPMAATVTDPQFLFRALPEHAAAYLWDLGNGTQSSLPAPAITYPQVIDSYKVVLMVTDSNGCADTATQWVAVMPPFVMIPNAFSPNQDGVNDECRIVNITDQQLLEYSIFNRFGQRVFYTMNPATGWNGTFNNNPCDVGNYYYLVRLQTKSREVLVYKGEVLLVR